MSEPLHCPLEKFTKKETHITYIFVQIVQRAAGMSSRSGEDQLEG
jgi:hypothetical protein